jgi:hypothetical protein
MKEEQTFKEPALSVVCVMIGVLTLLAGGSMLAFAIASASRPAPDAGSFIAVAFAVLFSSLIWFAIGKAINLLAQIAHNTRK